VAKKAAVLTMKDEMKSWGKFADDQRYQNQWDFEHG